MTEKYKEISEGLTYDDVLVVPDYSDILPSAVNTSNYFTKTININSKPDSINITFNKAVIATGSKPISLPFAKIDKKRIISSTEALELKEIPKKLIVIGGGVIGLELGQVYNRQVLMFQLLSILKKSPHLWINQFQKNF